MADMSREEKLRYYATAPRAGAKKIHRIENGDFVPYWLATLRRRAVTLKIGSHACKTRAEALEHARQFREACRRDLRKLEGEPCSQ